MSRSDCWISTERSSLFDYAREREGKIDRSGGNSAILFSLEKRGTGERKTHSLADLASFQSVDEKNIAEKELRKGGFGPERGD